MNNIQHKTLPPKIFNLKGWIKLAEEKKLTETFSDLLDTSGFTTLNYSSHQFPVNGFTAFWLLAESHLALHTFTESGWCYIELSSCNPTKAERFMVLASKLNYKIKWDEQLKTCPPTSPHKIVL